MDRYEIQSTKLAVNMCDEFRNLVFQFRRVGECGGRHLDENDIADPIGVVLQKSLKCSQLYIFPPKKESLNDEYIRLDSFCVPSAQHP